METLKFLKFLGKVDIDFHHRFARFVNYAITGEIEKK